MSRRRRRSQIAEQFMARIVSMLESPAYRALSLSAHRVISRLEVELAHHGGTDNGKLPCTYDDFEAYGIHRHSISAAVRECVALGFIEITEAGHAGNAEFRRPTKFRLTYVYTDKSCPPTHEWRKIETEQQAVELARIARNGNRNPVAENAKSQCGNHHRNHRIHSAETTTTGLSAETTTTSISWVGAADSEPRRISRRHRCRHCGGRGETVQVRHGLESPWLHPRCVGDWTAEFDGRAA